MKACPASDISPYVPAILLTYICFTYMKPFSRTHFSNVLLTMGPNFLKNKCSCGLTLVPGPLIEVYSLPFCHAFS